MTPGTTIEVPVAPRSPLPQGLLLCMLTWWGWQCGLVWWGLACGTLLEGARALNLRWELRPDDFRRLWNVTMLLLVGAGLYLFFAQEGWTPPGELMRDPSKRLSALNSATRAGLQFVQWLPLLFFPFIMAHACSSAGRLPWWTVSTLLARRKKREWGVAWVHEGFHPAPPYLLVALFAASASDRNPEFYLPAVALWVGWALWPHRSRRFRTATWTANVILVAALAFAGQLALLQLYRQLELLEARMLNSMGGGTYDQSGISSEIGALGRLKLSSRIVLRVRGEGSPPPELLREAVFNQFRSSRWLADRREFQPTLPLGDTLNWPLSDINGRRQLVTIERYSRAGHTPLALPGGAAELLGLAANTVETNRLTAARTESLLPLAVYTVVHGPDAGFDAPPDTNDLSPDLLVRAESNAVHRVAAELGLPGAAPKEALRRVQSFLATNYGYSLENRAQAVAATNSTTALTEFLTTTREGHCEYFATATTLLLRKAGVPTRYVVGWSVQETQGDGFVVRARHAHAWCIAHVDGRWQPVDNTPSNWAREEARLGGHWWEPVYDRFSDAWLWFTRFRQSDSRWRLYVFVGGIFLLAFMGWRELRGGRWRQTGRNLARRNTKPQGPGQDSEFYALLATLEKTHAPRPPAAPLRPWLQSLPLDGRHAQLDELLLLHYRLRFDPEGLDGPHRLALKEGVQRWLQGSARQT